MQYPEPTVMPAQAGIHDFDETKFVFTNSHAVKKQKDVDAGLRQHDEGARLVCSSIS